MNFDFMKDFMDRLTAWRMPGNSISVCIDNQEVFSYQSGYENYEKKIKMGTGHLFNVFSCSKPITVVAALQLYERGFFLLDDPLYDFLPEYKEMQVRDENGNLRKCNTPITLRHLFTMSSGLPMLTPPHKTVEEARKITDGKADTLTVIKKLAENELAFEPGTKWQYGISHDVLAAVVEVISGKKFRDYVSDNIFAPLEMKESYYHNEKVLDRVAEMYKYQINSDADLAKLQSTAQDKNEGELINVGKSVPYVFGTEYDSGGAGVTTSVSDYSKFASALANGGVGMNGEQIISSSTIELLRTNQLDEKRLKDITWSQLRGYGYGLGVRTMMDKAASGSTGSVGEFGWGGAAGATLLVDPDLKLSMFYTHHMLNPQEAYYQPRLRNVLYTCLNRY